MFGHGMMGWDGFGSFGWIGLIFNLVFTIVVFVGIIWMVIWLVRRTGSGIQNPGGLTPNLEAPREILQIRYARGEITRDQYREMLEDIG